MLMSPITFRYKVRRCFNHFDTSGLHCCNKRKHASMAHHLKICPHLTQFTRSSRSVSWPRGAFQGAWRLSSGPGGERQGCPKQKGADGGQVEVRLVQIDLRARMW